MPLLRELLKTVPNTDEATVCAVVTLVSLILVLFMKEIPMSRQSEAESSEN